MKLLEFIRERTGLSRRKIVDIHKSHPILVNGREAPFSYRLNKGDRVLFLKEVFVFEGQREEEYRYFLFHKPRGYVCSHQDRHNQTIFELLPDELRSFFIAGRLDKESRGLLILSNDGNFIRYLTHPSNEIEKEYRVKVKGKLTEKQFQHVLRGKVPRYRVKTIELEEYNAEISTYKIILTEGKKREIREIFRFFSLEVLDLLRIRIDRYQLNSLSEGELREILPPQIKNG